jgi:hypothetical protein
MVQRWEQKVSKTAKILNYNVGAWEIVEMNMGSDCSAGAVRESEVVVMASFRTAADAWAGVGTRLLADYGGTAGWNQTIWNLPDPVMTSRGPINIAVHSR